MLSTLFWQRGFLLKVRFLDWALSGKELHMRLEGFASSAVLGKWPGWLHGVDHCVAFVAAVCSLPVKRFGQLYWWDLGIFLQWLPCIPATHGNQNRVGHLHERHY